SLKNTLLKNQVFKSVTVGDSGKADINITIQFVRTYHQPDPQKYTFDVVMKAEDKDSEILKRYHIESEEIFMVAYFDNATDAMNKASIKLIDAIIKDLMPWLENG
ncbi:MAG: hypothetical protein RPV21_06980, partial [Candidatus Sedimenticola sp. (ex Thyasira tokunagai)]